MGYISIINTLPSEMKVKEHVDVLKVLRSNDPSSVIQSLYDNVYPKVTDYVTTNQGHRSDAEDIFQEALMKLLFYVKTNRIESGDKVEGFVYVVCLNAWKAKRKKAGKVVYEEFNTELQYADESIDEGEEERFEKVNVMTRCLEKVGENCRKILQLINYDKKTQTEVAELMGYSSVNAVKTRHYKCKKKLLKLINEA